MKEDHKPLNKVRKEIKMMNNNTMFALTAALNEAHLQPKDICDMHIEKQENLFYVCFRTDWQRYECYVEDESFQVLGLNFMPFTENWSGSLEYMTAAMVA